MFSLNFRTIVYVYLTIVHLASFILLEYPEVEVTYSFIVVLLGLIAPKTCSVDRVFLKILILSSMVFTFTNMVELTYKLKSINPMYTKPIEETQYDFSRTTDLEVYRIPLNLPKEGRS